MKAINETAYFAGGCFWCTEAVFRRIKGVLSVVSGYAGGTKNNPSYEEVSTGLSGHAETVKITFDPGIVSYETLLEIFWATHDPTTLNRQGNDTGTQYRSVIFYTTEEQKKTAEKSKKYLEENKEFDKPVVTEILPLSNFDTAEEYHQKYFDTNPAQSYCMLIINPKIEKLLEKFGNKVKEEYK